MDPLHHPVLINKGEKMIYTITANPSMDYVLNLEKFNLGEINRTGKAYTFAGGKGINVSRVLGYLGINSIALGFIGGSAGDFIQNSITSQGIHSKLTSIKDNTRINVKIKAESETEINGLGPQITQDEIDEFMSNFSMLTPEDIVVAAGSVPPALGKNFYQNLVKTVVNRQAQFVIDTTGQALLDILPSHPLLVKPNNHELAEMFNVSFNGTDDIVYYGKKLLNKGAKYVIVSMGGDGAILITPEQIYQSVPVNISVKNSVGAGDSMVAGFVGTYEQSHDLLAAFKMGLACGAATASSEDLGKADLINEILENIQVNKI